MKNELPEHKLKQNFLFFNKTEEKPSLFISSINVIFYFFSCMTLSIAMILFIGFSYSKIVNLIPENAAYREKMRLEDKLYEEATIKSKLNFFKTLSTQANKSQKEVINFLNQQQNDYLQISIAPIGENIIELNPVIYQMERGLQENSLWRKENWSQYSYLIEFEHDKMKHITLRDAKPFDIKYFQDSHQSFSIIEPIKKEIKNYKIKHVRVDLK